MYLLRLFVYAIISLHKQDIGHKYKNGFIGRKIQGKV